MTTDTISHKLGTAGSSRPVSSAAPSGDDGPPRSSHRRMRRVILAVGMLAVLGTAAALIPGTMVSQSDSPGLTHTITRGDLIVTVTEQGMLESSNNTEIKCKVRGFNTVTWVIEGGTIVEPGDELVRLDTKTIEETVSLTKTNAFLASATLERSKADVARAKIAIDAYKEGRYRAELQALENQVAFAERNLRVAKKMLQHSIDLFKKGYVTELEVEGNTFTVEQAELELKVQQTRKEVLEKYTREMELVRLQGNLTASRSKLQADEAGLAMDEARRDRAQEELEECVIRAERKGLVIYPSAAAWKREPDITEGATVRKDQVLLLMPDLTRMQVKVGIHESIVEQVKPGQSAHVTLPDRELEGVVFSVASVTRPAGWWTGNVVKYDTIIELPSVEGLKPGMSAEVEIELIRHEDVLTIPVAAVVETDEGDFCWVKTPNGTQKRSLQLGDSNDVFVLVQAGLKEGDDVVLNPAEYIAEAEEEALNPLVAETAESEAAKADSAPESQEPGN